MTVQVLGRRREEKVLGITVLMFAEPLTVIGWFASFLLSFFFQGTKSVFLFAAHLLTDNAAGGVGVAGSLGPSAAGRGLEDLMFFGHVIPRVICPRELPMFTETTTYRTGNDLSLGVILGTGNVCEVHCLVRYLAVF